MDLETIYRCWGHNKQRGRPGRNIKHRVAMVREGDENWFHRAKALIVDCKGKLDSKLSCLYDEAGTRVLELVEIGNDHGTAGYSGANNRGDPMSGRNKKRPSMVSS